MKHLFFFRHYDFYWGHGKLSCGILLSHKHFGRLIMFDYKHYPSDPDNDWWHRY